MVTFLSATRRLVVFPPGLGLFQVGPRYPMTGNEASGFGPLALRQNPEAVHGPDKLTHQNPHIQFADPCSEASKRRKEFINPLTNSRQFFCVMDSPEICQSPGFLIVGEFLTAIEASDVRSLGIAGSASRQTGWDGLAHGYRRTLVPMGTNKNETKQCP